VLKGSPLVTYLVLVEPADEHRQGFARWCLAQDPPIMTASSSGSEVPADLFATIPDELLDGARVDGTVFRPVIEGFGPGSGDTYAPEQPGPAAQPKPRARKTADRRRTARKGTAQ
jgi:hypothetical protein